MSLCPHGGVKTHTDVTHYLNIKHTAEKTDGDLQKVKSSVTTSGAETLIATD